jgi:hypothetical protein
MENKMKLTVIAGFSWAHRGVLVEAFEVGAVIETDDEDLILVGMGEGWVVGQNAVGAAPENKAMKPPKNKQDADAKFAESLVK